MTKFVNSTPLYPNSISPIKSGFYYTTEAQIVEFQMYDNLCQQLDDH